MLFDESQLISQVKDGNRVVEVNFVRPLHHGCKVSYLLHALMLGRT